MSTRTDRDRSSRQRQSLRQLGEEAAKLIEVFVSDQPLMRGSVYEMRRKCGKASCVCATQGRLHSSRVISWSEKGSTRLRVIPKGSFAEFRILTRRYQRFRKARARLVKIHERMLAIIGQLEETRRKES